MREYILQMDGTYIGIFLVLIAIVPPWILYLDKFFPLVEQKKEPWLNDFIPWAWQSYIPLFIVIYLFPTILTLWIITSLIVSTILYFVPKPINIKKRFYWSFYSQNSSELDRKKWENSFIRKFIICHFWSSWLVIISSAIYYLFLKK